MNMSSDVFGADPMELQEKGSRINNIAVQFRDNYRMILPAHNMNGINPAHYKIELVPVRRVVEAVRELFG